MNSDRRLKPLDVLLSLAVVASLWVLVVVFCLVLPSILEEVVHKSDKEILAKVERLAVEAALASAVSGAVLALCLRQIWIRCRKRVRNVAG